MARLLAPFAGDGAGQLAERLRAEFGGLRQALHTAPARLREVAGEYAEACSLILAARELVDAADFEEVLSAPVDPANPGLVSHLVRRIGYLKDERLVAIFCDSQGNYLADEDHALGTEHEVRLVSADLFRRALTLDASAILLAHNHPSGHCRPSPQDIEGTRDLAELAGRLRLRLLDHLIVTRRQAYSMRAGGYL